MNSIRTSISVPSGLKQAMDRVTRPTNWSKIASIAFEQHLIAIESGEEPVSTDKRLKQLGAEIGEAEQDVLGLWDLLQAMTTDLMSVSAYLAEERISEAKLKMRETATRLNEACQTRMSKLKKRCIGGGA